MALQLHKEGGFDDEKFLQQRQVGSPAQKRWNQEKKKGEKKKKTFPFPGTENRMPDGYFR